MKKILILILIVALLAVGFAGCNKAPAEEPMEPETEAEEQKTESEPSEDGYEIAMITDKGDITDVGFNQYTFAAVKEYAEANGISYKYYKPLDANDAEYLASIELAIKGGAKIIVVPGFLWGSAIYQAQDMYPETSFILLDTTPYAADFSDFTVGDNVYSVIWAEEQVGFFAGYAAVKDGYTKLAYFGGQAVPAVIKYGYGFIAGADYAAKEMGIDDVEVKFHYTGDFIPTPKNQTTCATMYADGTEVIFAAGGGITFSTIAAAEAVDGKIIGVDVDQSALSETIITSAMKFLGLAVKTGLESYYAGDFLGGVDDFYHIGNAGLGMEMENAKFNVFTTADYDAVVALLKDADNGVAAGIPTNDTHKAPTDIETEVVKVIVVE